jgi:hypothetical protein
MVNDGKLMVNGGKICLIMLIGFRSGVSHWLKLMECASAKTKRMKIQFLNGCLFTRNQG